MKRKKIKKGHLNSQKNIGFVEPADSFYIFSEWILPFQLGCLSCMSDEQWEVKKLATLLFRRLLPIFFG